MWRPTKSVGWAATAAFAWVQGWAVAGDAGPAGPTGASIPAAAVWTAPAVDTQRLLGEDERGRRDTLSPDRPLRVGVPLRAGLTPSGSGRWETDPAGQRTWRLTVRSPGARWLVLGFDVFDLAAGASLSVLDAAGRVVRGPLTRADRQLEGGLWLPPLAGDELTLELFWPASLSASEPALRLGTVAHGYRTLAGIEVGPSPAEPASVSASASCNIDVNCPTGAPLDDERRGVVYLLINGSFLCSGALVNNTSLDCQPYVLSAKHCYDPPGNGPGNTTFFFNYERPACGGGAPITNQTISGAQFIASSAPSDFQLMKLTQSPVQLGFDVFFNGWSRSGSTPIAGWAIHHPEGDVKKIARDTGPLITDPGPTYGAAYWKVNQWEEGTTENGSSGAPLFDQNRRIVGQLRAGAPTPCVNPKSSWFGKLSVSWAGGGTPTTRLSDALDPGATGATVLEGMDGSFCGALAPQLDLASWSIDDTQGNQDGVAEPGDVLELAIDLRNFGPLSATAVGGTLTTAHPDVTVVDGQAGWPDIPANQTATSSAPHFTIAIGPQASCAGSIPFQLALSSAQGGFARSFALELGQDTEQRAGIFVDNVESGLNGWTVQTLAGSNAWGQSSADSLSPTKSWRILDPGSGPHDSVLLAPSVGALPAAAVLRFWHHMQSETGFDGGVLELSTDGATWQDAGPFITQGGYVGAISLGSGALAGREAWTGDLGGWLEVEVDLASFAGQNLRARFRFATNALGGATAWAIDDVVIETRILACPQFPGSRCRGTQPPPGGGAYRPHTCGAPRPQPAPHP